MLTAQQVKARKDRGGVSWRVIDGASQRTLFPVLSGILLGPLYQEIIYRKWDPARWMFFAGPFFVGHEMSIATSSGE